MKKGTHKAWEAEERDILDVEGKKQGSGLFPEETRSSI